MSFSTFSGPIRSGTVREGSGANTGLVVLSKSVAIPPTATSATTTIGTLPAGSQIIDFIVDTTTVFNQATTLIIGTASNDDEYLVATTTITSAARLDPSTVAANMTASCVNVGTSDVTLIAKTAGSASTGAATITVIYVQRADDGSQVPASA